MPQGCSSNQPVIWMVKLEVSCIFGKRKIYMGSNQNICILIHIHFLPPPHHWVQWKMEAVLTVDLNTGNSQNNWQESELPFNQEWFVGLGKPHRTTAWSALVMFHKWWQHSDAIPWPCALPFLRGSLCEWFLLLDPGIGREEKSGAGSLRFRYVPCKFD